MGAEHDVGISPSLLYRSSARFLGNFIEYNGFEFETQHLLKTLDVEGE